MLCCHHADCLTLVTGATHSGTTLMTRTLVELGLNPLPECMAEHERGARYGMEGRMQELGHRIAMAWHSGDAAELRELVADMDALPARVVKSPTVAMALERVVALSERLAHVVICVRDPHMVAQRWVERHGYGSGPDALVHVLAHYGAAVWGAHAGGVRYGIVVYPDDWCNPVTMTYALRRAGLVVDAQDVAHVTSRLFEK